MKTTPRGRQTRTLAWLLLSVSVGPPTPMGCNSKYDYESKTDVSVEVATCEEAYARLEECCPGFMGGQLGLNEGWEALCNDFAYVKQESMSCDGSTGRSEGHIEPALSRAETTCIFDSSCDTIRNTGVCGRASQAHARGNSRYSPGSEGGGQAGSVDRELQPLVCP